MSFPTPSSPSPSPSSSRPLSIHTTTSTLPPPPIFPSPSSLLAPSDLQASRTAYTTLLTTAKSFRLALSTLSTASASFGAALETCARLKESLTAPSAVPGSASTSTSIPTSIEPTGGLSGALMAAGGLHQLIANHHNILSETLYRNFEVPLLTDLDNWTASIEKEEATYSASLAAKTHALRKCEKEGVTLQRQKRRNIAGLRRHLVKLAGLVDDLSSVHASYAEALMREGQAMAGMIVDAACSIVRAEVEIYEGLARKGWSGGGLEDVLERGTDLFAPDEEALRVGMVGDGVGSGGAEVREGEAKLFSILAPMGLLAEEERELGLGRGNGDVDVPGGEDDEDPVIFARTERKAEESSTDTNIDEDDENDEDKGKGKEIHSLSHFETPRTDDERRDYLKNNDGVPTDPDTSGTEESGASTPRMHEVTRGVRNTELLVDEHHAIWARDDEA